MFRKCSTHYPRRLIFNGDVFHGDITDKNIYFPFSCCCQDKEANVPWMINGIGALEKSVKVGERSLKTETGVSHNGMALAPKIALVSHLVYFIVLSTHLIL